MVSLQIVPKGRKWTSAFQSCGGGYLASNHIGLIGLTRCGKATRYDAPSWDTASDWTTAVNIRFQRGRDTVKNVLAYDRHGMFQVLNWSQRSMRFFASELSLSDLCSVRGRPKASA